MNIGMGWKGGRGEYRKRGNRRERRLEEEQKRKGKERWERKIHQRRR